MSNDRYFVVGIEADLTDEQAELVSEAIKEAVRPLVAEVTQTSDEGQEQLRMLKAPPGLSEQHLSNLHPMIAKLRSGFPFPLMGVMYRPPDLKERGRQ